MQPSGLDVLSSAEREARYCFPSKLDENGVELSPVSVATLQINLTRLCNQACRHCHVDASPARTEAMDESTLERCLEILAEHERIRVLDVTGGAPELHPQFDRLVKKARNLGKHVMVRHNLTVTFDGNPQTGESKRYLPEFFAEQRVEVISSLPYYQPYFTDKQRGKGVFEKSVESLRLLNEQGFGQETSGLALNLVYNPVGAFLPAAQEELETRFREELHAKYGIVFTGLFTITNMPIHRFRQQLERLGGFDDYMRRLVGAFNPAAAESVMCRAMISVGHDGRIYDCDFNQMLGMQIENGAPCTVDNFDLDELLKRRIRFASHCFGCTAGSGSSCGGATA